MLKFCFILFAALIGYFIGLSAKKKRKINYLKLKKRTTELQKLNAQSFNFWSFLFQQNDSTIPPS